ncbi:MAG: sulfite exporter TauE/SafE family protein [Flavobacterium sp.]|nr:MAG: sulfite exporter TauE/SafE family protein [Flavobacterium sp.]
MDLYLGYFFAIVIGLVLGLTGGGGSIMTVPVMVYIIGLNPVTATAYSLFTVGATSAVGTVRNIIDKSVDIKTGLLYAIPSLIGVYFSRKFIISSIPAAIFYEDEFIITKDKLLMVVFAIVVFIIAFTMLRKRDENQKKKRREKPVLMALKLLAAGVIVGFVGAGGGFLFTPLLLYAAKLPMKKAVATSLLIISINSLLGFTGDIGNIVIDWTFLLCFSLFSIGGIFLGIYLNRFINEKQLKTGFAWFVIAISLFVLTKEIVF